MTPGINSGITISAIPDGIGMLPLSLTFPLKGKGDYLVFGSRFVY
jgi:hypothetical protein